jgi:hypothetical protein
MAENEADNIPTLPTRAESPQQAALYAWFAEQRTKSVDNLEQAARQIITLCTTLLGLLLGLLALTEDPLPTHIHWSGVQWLGGAGVVALLVALGGALYAILPRRIPVNLNDPKDLQNEFDALLARKSLGLQVAVVGFGAGMAFLGIIVVVALALIVPAP